MKVLITAGPTHEPIDPVRYIGNRSSGQMGAALADAALAAGHTVTLLLGPVSATMPKNARRVDVETSRQMHDAVLSAFPAHELLIMAAAVADFRPVDRASYKMPRAGKLTIELEPTEDILAAAGAIKRPDQRTIGFSLVDAKDLDRSRQKLKSKNVDLLVHNPTQTMNSTTIEATLLYPGGCTEHLASRPKHEFADILIRRASDLFQ